MAQLARCFKHSKKKEWCQDAPPGDITKWPFSNFRMRKITGREQKINTGSVSEPPSRHKKSVSAQFQRAPPSPCCDTPTMIGAQRRVTDEPVNGSSVARPRPAPPQMCHLHVLGCQRRRWRGAADAVTPCRAIPGMCRATRRSCFLRSRTQQQETGLFL